MANHWSEGQQVSQKRVPLGFGQLSAALGDHIGHFYESMDERTRILVSFLSAGIEAGDKCVCIISPTARPDFEQALSHAGVQIETTAASGQLLVHEGAEPEGMKALLADALKDVPERFPVLRWVGDMTWSLGKMPTAEKLMEWESHCNVVEDPPAVFLCQYDLTAFQGNVVMDALKTHPTCVVNNVIHQNPYYQTPEDFLEQLAQRDQSALAG